tara:strand:- start:129 stop:326 length:198 start_codon:yes stop_codon:yes gene_type:complete
MENQLSPRQADILNENIILSVCFELGMELRKGFCSEVRKLELVDAEKKAWNMAMEQNWINTEKLN